MLEKLSKYLTRGIVRNVSLTTLTAESANTGYVYSLGSTPLNTDGYEVFAVPYTPTMADSVLHLQFCVYGNASDNRPVGALFKNADTAPTRMFPSPTNADVNYAQPIPGDFWETAGSILTRTYRIHLAASGVAGGNVVYINSGATATPYGGSLIESFLRITEYAPSP